MESKQLEPDYSKMEYRHLGKTGLKVSVLGYGNWLNSNDKAAFDFTRSAIKECLSMGVNFFDTAEIYGFGEAETQMGQAFKDLNVRRESIVVSTKIYRSSAQGLNDQMMSSKHIVEGLQHSLKRLQLDYVDVVFSHRPDYETSLEECCATMNYIIEKGMAFYWGTSEWTPQRIAAAIGICEKNGWHKPVVEQPQYSMVKRDKFEREFFHIF
jgi:hypothetical protein